MVTRTPKQLRKLVVASGAGTLLALALAAPSLADNQVTTEVQGGLLSALFEDAGLSAVPYSFSNETSTGSVTLVASDERGTAAGWTVTMQVTAPLDGPGANEIPAANLSITGYGTVTAISGDSDPLPATGATGALNVERTVLSAADTEGAGIYNAPVNLALDVPAESPLGTYTATVIVTANDLP